MPITVTEYSEFCAVGTVEFPSRRDAAFEAGRSQGANGFPGRAQYIVVGESEMLGITDDGFEAGLEAGTLDAVMHAEYMASDAKTWSEFIAARDATAEARYQRTRDGD